MKIDVLKHVSCLIASMRGTVNNSYVCPVNCFKDSASIQETGGEFFRSAGGFSRVAQTVTILGLANLTLPLPLILKAHTALRDSFLLVTEWINRPKKAKI